MVRRVFLFDTPDRFVAGTVGEPGNRTFFLQARHAGRIVSIALEKVQVAALAERLDALLDELERRGVEAEGPDGTSTRDVLPLDEPLNEAFRAGTLSLGWDSTAELVLVEALAQVEIDEDDEDDDDEEEVAIAEDDPDGPDLLRVRMSAAAARGFVERAVRVLSAGRPPCPLCGEPLDPQGHLCPRRNGHLLN